LYLEPAPDDTTLLRWAKQIEPATLEKLNERVVTLACQAKVTRGRKLRVDGTVVATNIHHPTDAALLADAVRAMSRLLRRAKARGGRRPRKSRVPGSDPRRAAVAPHDPPTGPAPPGSDPAGRAGGPARGSGGAASRGAAPESRRAHPEGGRERAEGGGTGAGG